jgi:hypothetical protein
MCTRKFYSLPCPSQIEWLVLTAFTSNNRNGVLTGLAIQAKNNELYEASKSLKSDILSLPGMSVQKIVEAAENEKEWKKMISVYG